MTNKFFFFFFFLLVNHTASAQCAQLNSSGQWATVDCPSNTDCGEKDPSKYPWVVLIYKQGKYDGMNDYKTKETAEQQMKFWEHFNNISWPKFSNTEFDLYKYYGPFRKCLSPTPQLTKNKMFDMVRPYLEDWKSKLKDGYQILYQNKDISSHNTFREYLRGLKNAEKSVNNLENVLNGFTDESLEYLKENIGNLYEAGNQMNEAKKANYSLLPNAPLDYKIPDFAKAEIAKRKNGIYEFGETHRISPSFKLSKIQVSGNNTTLFFELTCPDNSDYYNFVVNKNNENEFFILDEDNFRYKMISVIGTTPNVKHTIYRGSIIKFSCVFKGRLNNVSGPFTVIEGKNAYDDLLGGNNQSSWNIPNITLE